jgi:hypothetical protein
MDLGKIIEDHESAARARKEAEKADAATRAQRAEIMLQEHAQIIQSTIKEVILPVFEDAQNQLNAKGLDPRVREATSKDKRLREIIVEIELDLQGTKRHLPSTGHFSYILRYTGDVDKLTFSVEMEIYNQRPLAPNLTVPVSDVDAPQVEKHVTAFVSLVADQEAKGF